MNEQNPSAALHDIKRMMERSSRFISLSGLSGISAGVCALIGAAVAYPYISGGKAFFINDAVAFAQAYDHDWGIMLNIHLFWIAVATFAGALMSAFFFTMLKSKKDGVPIWGSNAKRLMINVTLPMIAGGIFLFRMLYADGTAWLIAPGCLIFYGLALINASKYTLSEIRYLGYCQVLLGLINLWCIGYGLYFWAFGFGVLHIVYGIYMWMKYERKTAAND